MVHPESGVTLTIAIMVSPTPSVTLASQASTGGSSPSWQFPSHGRCQLVSEYVPGAREKCRPPRPRICRSHLVTADVPGSETSTNPIDPSM